MIIATGRNESSVGVGLLDCDHRQIDEALRKLHAQIASGRNRSQTGDLLRSLSSLTLLHFALEEGMMEAARYPMLARHRANHRHMMQEMNILISSCIDRGIAPDDRWLSLIAQSTSAHIRTDDLYFGSWLKSN